MSAWNVRDEYRRLREYHPAVRALEIARHRVRTQQAHEAAISAAETRRIEAAKRAGGEA